MQQSEHFSLRLSPQEKLMISRIAKHQERSQADTVRKIIRDTYRAMQAEVAKDSKPEARETYAAV